MRPLSLVGAVVGVAALLACSSSCSSEQPFDRARAVDELVVAESGRLTREQATCYVDRVVGEVGSDALDRSTSPKPEHAQRLAAIRIDCVGIENLGTTGGSVVPTTSATGSGVTEPQRQGDDPHLDELYSECASTGGAACDQLFDEAPPGSAYEEFASSCGGRTKELSCAATYAAGGGTTPDGSATSAPR